MGNGVNSKKFREVGSIISRQTVVANKCKFGLDTNLSKRVWNRKGSEHSA